MGVRFCFQTQKQAFQLEESNWCHAEDSRAGGHHVQRETWWSEWLGKILPSQDHKHAGHRCGGGHLMSMWRARADDLWGQKAVRLWWRGTASGGFQFPATTWQRQSIQHPRATTMERPSKIWWEVRVLRIRPAGRDRSPDRFFVLCYLLFRLKRTGKQWRWEAWGVNWRESIKSWWRKPSRRS